MLVNSRPVPHIDSDGLAAAGDTVQFDAIGSVAAPGGRIVKYTWDYGDGLGTDTTTGQFSSHVYVFTGTTPRD